MGMAAPLSGRPDVPRRPRPGKVSDGCACTLRATVSSWEGVVNAERHAGRGKGRGDKNGPTTVWGDVSLSTPEHTQD